MASRDTAGVEPHGIRLNGHPTCFFPRDIGGLFLPLSPPAKRNLGTETCLIHTSGTTLVLPRREKGGGDVRSMILTPTPN